jgi:serine protease AprX
MKKKNKIIMFIALLLLDSFGMQYAIVATDKPSDCAGCRQIKTKIESLEEDDFVTVGVWFSDIDQKAVDETALRKSNRNRKRTADQQAIQKYIEIKRELLREKYKSNNLAYREKYFSGETVLFVSNYAPFMIGRMPIRSIRNVLGTVDVTAMELYTNMPKSEEESPSVSNIHADVTRDRMQLTGMGVKVGVLEGGYPDMTNPQLSDRNIFLDISDKAAAANVSEHATRVICMIAGKTNGIAPDATIYAAASNIRLDDFKKIEWMLDKGVNIINFSAGYDNECGYYTEMARWIDHLAYQADVAFIKSAGNNGPEGEITDPGMAYNAITVGSIGTNQSAQEPYWLDDYFTQDSSYREREGGYKPDLTAPGENIAVAGFESHSGTSYAAPYVSGVIAQVLETRPDLKLKFSALNAVLKAGTTHKTADDYGIYELMPDYSNKEGAGVIDALGACKTANANQYLEVQVSKSSFPYIKKITIRNTQKPVRVVLNWIKQNTLRGDFVIDKSITDLDLYVYQPDNTLAKCSCSANNNTELVEFTPSMQGTYQIVVQGYELSNAYEIIGLAWNQ